VLPIIQQRFWWSCIDVVSRVLHIVLTDEKQRVVLDTKQRSIFRLKIQLEEEYLHTPDRRSTGSSKQSDCLQAWHSPFRR